MRVAVVSRRDAEYERETDEWMRDFTDETGIPVDFEDIETISGEIFATSHDIVRYPTVCVVDGDSKIITSWEGKLPQFEEVTYVMRDA